MSKVAVAPIMGAPDAVSKDLGGHLSSALASQRVSVAGGSEKADYTVRGYMVATKERAGTKVSYIFDLNDAAGKRVNRVQGEEQAQGAGADPWAAVTPDMMRRITEKAAKSLSDHLASTPAATASTTPPSPAGVGAGAIPNNSSPPATQTAAASPAGPATTGSLERASILVPAVTGAPGDGSTSLADAMRQELQQAGLSSAAPGQKGYSVAGRVKMGTVKQGKQPIKIVWRVTGPAGEHVADIEQDNEIQAGALDGPWGPIASDAAQGAAAKIKALIEENRAAAASGTPRTKTAARSRS